LFSDLRRYLGALFNHEEAAHNASVFKGAAFQFVPCQDIACMAVDRFSDWAGSVALPFEIRCRRTPDIRLLALA
jgi:hypothetical protein